jgi:hypothetical protein
MISAYTSSLRIVKRLHLILRIGYFSYHDSLAPPRIGDRDGADSRSFLYEWVRLPKDVTLV